jgi:hypothetical protein
MLPFGLAFSSIQANSIKNALPKSKFISHMLLLRRIHATPLHVFMVSGREDWKSGDKVRELMSHTRTQHLTLCFVCRNVHADRFVEVDTMSRMSDVDEDGLSLGHELCTYTLERQVGRDLIVKPFLLLNGLCKRDAGREFLSGWLNQPMVSVDESSVEERLWNILSSPSCDVKRKHVPRYISNNLLKKKESMMLVDILSDPVLESFLMQGIDGILANGLVDVEHQEMDPKRLTVNGLLYHLPYVPQQMWRVCNHELGNLKEMISREGYGSFEKNIEKKIMEGSYKAFNDHFFSSRKEGTMSYTPFCSELSNEMKLNTIVFPRKGSRDGASTDGRSGINDNVSSSSQSPNVAQVMLHVVINGGDNDGEKAVKTLLEQIVRLANADFPFQLRVVLVPYYERGDGLGLMNRLLGLSTFQELVEFARDMPSSSSKENAEIDPSRLEFLENINKQVIAFKHGLDDEFRDGFVFQGRFVAGREHEDELVTAEMIEAFLLNEWEKILSKVQERIGSFLTRFPELAPRIS